MHLYLSLITKSLRITLVIVVSLLLSHCASRPAPQYDPSPVETREVGANGEEIFDPSLEVLPGDQATPYLEQNRINVERAEYYEQLANSQGAGNDQVDSSLSAAEYYIQAGDYNQAEETISRLNISYLRPAQLNRYTVIKAYVDYSRGQFNSALQNLQSVLATNQASLGDNANTVAIENQTQLVDALLLSSFCYQELNDFDSAIAALIQRESLLAGSARAETTRYTWQIINSLSKEQRQDIADQTNNVLVRNRLEQSFDGQFADRTDMPPQFDQWRETSSLIQNTQTIDSDWNANSPKRIAVLLPLTSRFSKAAHAVMDGIEYHHNANLSPFKPSVDFFDIGDNPYQASQYYSSISRMGFDLVIGPIGKDYANQLYNAVANQNLGGIPTMLLGGDVDLRNQYNNTFTRLTMSPEAEGIEVANYARRSGHVTAAILTPNTETGQRTSQAFQQQWLGNGGNISKTITYSPTQFDHSIELKQLFDINQSQARYNKISNVLGFKPEFSAYRRADVDFIFMIADNDSGRIVRPQINFFSGETVPVYATSTVFNGIQDETNNLDLEDTQFPVMPWILQSIDIAPYAGQLNMLFAMGSDAYQVAANYQTMRNNPTLAISGNMGTLNIEESGDIIYRPVWAKFRNGLAEANSELPSLEGINRLPGGNSSETGSNSYNDSNWDTRQSSRKTGTTIP